MSYNNNFSYFNAPTSNNEWWGSKDTKKPTVFEERGIVKIDYNNQPYAQNYMQNYAQSMILPSENRSVDPIHPRHEVLQGTVTQLFSAFGYVNDNIIFSKSDVTGPMVKVGDRVAVDATYQPNNPTKYKGERVCKIDDSRFSSPVSSNLSKMKPLSKDISTRIDIPLTTYRSEISKFEPPKKPEPKPPIKKFEKPIEQPPPPPPPRPVIIPKEVKQPEPKRIVKAISPIDLTRSEGSRSNSSRKASYKSPPKSSATKRKLKRSSEQRSSSKSKTSKSSEREKSERSEKPTLSSSVTTVAKINVEKLAKQQESFSLRELDCASLKFRCKNLQPPNQFFHASLKYQMSFPLNHPMKLGNACHFKVMDKKVTSIDPLVNSQLHRNIDPEDADTTFSAKVMLLSTDDLASFYKNTLVLAEEFDSTNKIQITKAIKFLVGGLGANKEFAFGGAWSPSLDGHDPDNNPQVLINTAIRTCKSLTGIDLSGCSSWPKFLELHYYRPLQKIQKRTSPPTDKTTNVSSPANFSPTDQGPTAESATGTNSINGITSGTATTNGNGPASVTTSTENKSGTEPMDVTEERFEYIEPRMETVVYYVPDIWNCVTSQEGWNEIKRAYQEQLTSLMCPPPSFPVPHAHSKQDTSSSGLQKKTGLVTQQPSSNSAVSSSCANGNSIMDSQQQQHHQQEEEDYNYFNESEEMEDKTGKDGVSPTGSASPDEQPSHFSSLNVDSMKIVEIKKELDRRKLSNRGVMDQLKARLKTALDKEESEEKSKDGAQVSSKSTAAEPKAATDTVLSEAEKAELKQFYVLPDVPHIIVHQNMRYRGNSMRIKTMSLHSLLSYYDMKLEEATFEIALFAKQFQEMLRRDAVFNIYKSLVVTPEADFVVKAAENPSKKPKLLVTTSKRTVDRPLLFSCSILDREKSGKISVDDLKAMIEGLGICLSSDQLTSLLAKIPDPARGLHYRVLTDKEIDDNELTKMLTVDQTDDLDYICELAMGNKALFDSGSDAPVDSRHRGDYDEIDRLKNELDKSERCRQSLELRFSELREETEKNRGLIGSQVKEITRLKEQSTEYRTRCHREQDRGDYYKKELDRLYRDLKDIEKISGSLGKAVLETLERCKKSSQVDQPPKLPAADSKSKPETRDKAKGGRASSTSSSSVGHSASSSRRASRKSVVAAAARVPATESVATTSGTVGEAAGAHSGIIAGNDEDRATEERLSVTAARDKDGEADAQQPHQTATARGGASDLDVELMDSSHHDISLEADVDDVLLRPEDDLCLLPADDDLDMIQCSYDDEDDEEEEDQDVHSPDARPTGQLDQPAEAAAAPSSPAAEATISVPSAAAGDSEEAMDTEGTGGILMSEQAANHHKANEQHQERDHDLDQDQDFELSRPQDYEIIIIDETE